MDLGADAEHGAHCAVQCFLTGLNIRDLVGELLGGEFDVNVEGIRVVLAVYDDLVVRRIAFLQEDRLDLARERTQISLVR